MKGLHQWCTAHSGRAAVLVSVATAIYLGLALIAPRLAETVALGYLVIVGTVAVAVDWGRSR